MSRIALGAFGLALSAGLAVSAGAQPAGRIAPAPAAGGQGGGAAALSAAAAAYTLQFPNSAAAPGQPPLALAVQTLLQALRGSDPGTALQILATPPSASVTEIDARTIARLAVTAGRQKAPSAWARADLALGAPLAGALETWSTEFRASVALDPQLAQAWRAVEPSPIEVSLMARILDGARETAERLGRPAEDAAVEEVPGESEQRAWTPALRRVRAQPEDFRKALIVELERSAAARIVPWDEPDIERAAFGRQLRKQAELHQPAAMRQIQQNRAGVLAALNDQALVRSILERTLERAFGLRGAAAAVGGVARQAFLDSLVWAAWPTEYYYEQGALALVGLRNGADRLHAQGWVPVDPHEVAWNIAKAATGAFTRWMDKKLPTDPA